MNAIINLNHFCENHGPQTIFTTQTLRDKSLLKSPSGSNSNNNINPCFGCSSIGDKIVFMTEDKDSSIMFVSSEKSIFGKENQNSITLRSLSCEVRKISDFVCFAHLYETFRLQAITRKDLSSLETRNLIHYVLLLKLKIRWLVDLRSFTRLLL